MGWEFRTGNYHKRVWIGKRTVKDGEAAAVWDMSGKHTEIVGPKRIWMFFSNIRFEDQHIATKDEYIVIKFKDGHIQHIQGPHRMYRNPVMHESVHVEKCIRLLSENQVLIIFRQADATQTASLSAVPSPTSAGALTCVKLSGPLFYVPAVGEIVHTFHWSGTDEKGKFTRDVNNFQILRTNPQKWSPDMKITTADKAVAVVHLLIQYRLAGRDGLDRLLCTSADPIQDLYCALQTDLSRIGPQFDSARLQSDDFRVALGEKRSYGELVKRAEEIGFEVLSVSYRGYEPSKELAELYASARARAASLEAVKAEAEQKNQLASLSIDGRRQRLVAQHELRKEELGLRHALHMESLRLHAEADTAGEAHQAVRRRRAQDETLAFVKALKAEGVQLTPLLCAAQRSDSALGRAVTAPLAYAAVDPAFVATPAVGGSGSLPLRPGGGKADEEEAAADAGQDWT